MQSVLRIRKTGFKQEKLKVNEGRLPWGTPCAVWNSVTALTCIKIPRGEIISVHCDSNELTTNFF